MTRIVCRDTSRDRAGMAGTLVAKHLPSMRAGRHSDGGGLYFYVRVSSRSWLFRYRDRDSGKLRDMGLGRFPDVSLSEARAKATDQRRLLREGVNPIEAKREARVASSIESASSRTFKQCCDSYVEAHRPGWRNAKHASQWVNTLNTYCASLNSLPVQAIETSHVLNVLQPIWTTKTETATRVRQRMEAVLDWATARKYRKGENPARWRGHLDKLLPAASKVSRVVPREALPYKEMAEFWTRISAIDTLASKAARFQILTATRPNEAVGARWDEVDLDAAIWTIPAERMKAGKAHRVPLSREAVQLLSSIGVIRDGWLFPGKNDRSITTAATLKVVQGLVPGLTAHGFRSTFRDWAADQTNYSREIAEAALAHQLKDKTEAAYRRSDLLERRGHLMQDWGSFCTTKPMSR